MWLQANTSVCFLLLIFSRTRLGLKCCRAYKILRKKDRERGWALWHAGTLAHTYNLSSQRQKQKGPEFGHFRGYWFILMCSHLTLWFGAQIHGCKMPCSSFSLVDCLIYYMSIIWRQTVGSEHCLHFKDIYTDWWPQIPAASRDSHLHLQPCAKALWRPEITDGSAPDVGYVVPVCTHLW